MTPKITTLSVLFFIACLALAEEPASDFKEAGKLDYKSDVYSCRFDKVGYLWDFNFKDKKIIKIGGLFLQEKAGTYTQYQSKGGPLMVKDLGNNSYILKREGTLGARKNKDDAIATFEQTVTLKPDELIFDYKIKSVKDFASQRGIPLKLRCDVFSEPFSGRGYKVTFDDGKSKLDTFPSEIPKHKFLFWRNVDKFGVAITEDYVMTIATADKKDGITFLCQGKNNRYILSIGKDFTYSSSPRPYPKGSDLSFSFSIKFTKN
jgi:hypothetical protein